MRIVPVACLKDNYAYLVVASGGEAAVVDASEAAPVRAAVRREGVRLAAIWSTHHHYDHVGGNEEIAREFGVEVVAHVSDRGRVPGQTREVDTGDIVRVGDVEARCIHIPGHTLGAVAYYVDAPASRSVDAPASRSVGAPAPSADAMTSPVVFTGDTLFCAGCGRIFEGTPAMMHASLERLAALPGETRVFCGHEYTASNLRFAAHVEPDNAAVARAVERTAALRSHGEPAVGTTIDEERQCNPFLRPGSAAIRATLGIAKDADDVTAFAAIRSAKDSFR
ncbi:MAG TPA: hydroxyacylglutathione hydrolase [Polyangiaceae bacterium]|nr:hydroxyacylglutathione hydrolase [Polyangiaceae bacterium]